jgi:hypothetical protein
MMVQSNKVTTFPLKDALAIKVANRSKSDISNFLKDNILDSPEKEEINSSSESVSVQSSLAAAESIKHPQKRMATSDRIQDLISTMPDINRR